LKSFYHTAGMRHYPRRKRCDHDHWGLCVLEKEQADAYHRLAVWCLAAWCLPLRERISPTMTTPAFIAPGFFEEAF
jgi:hypothetical protein